MDLRNLLAGAAAITLAGTLPAAAQAPRSLFDAAPADSSPVTMGLDKPALSPSKPAEKTARVEEPASAPAVALPASPAPIAALPAKPDASAVKPDAAPAKPGSAAQEKARRPRRLAAREDASKPLAPEAAAPEAAPQAAPEAAAPKPLTRAEKRRARRQAAADAAAPASPAPAPAPANPFQSLFGTFQQPSASSAGPTLGRGASRSDIDSLVAYHARLNNVPESLVHRIIVRESKYNPRAVGRGGAMGLMQIKTATARGVGYTGGPGGLLDAETNLTYGVKYLAGAWRVSGGSYDRAVMHYARGYYYEAKRMGLSGPRSRRGHETEPAATASATPQAPSLFSLFRQ